MARAAQNETFTVREATASELKAVLGVQYRAFGRVARALGIDPTRLPPLVESLDDLSSLRSTGVRFFVAVDPGGVVLGSVRGSVDADGVVEIGRLVVDDGALRRGVATALMDALEAAHPGARSFELFTGAGAQVPLALYAGRGYSEFKRAEQEGVELIWLRKTVRSA